MKRLVVMFVGVSGVCGLSFCAARLSGESAGKDRKPRARRALSPTDLDGRARPAPLPANHGPRQDAVQLAETRLVETRKEKLTNLFREGISRHRTDPAALNQFLMKFRMEHGPDVLASDAIVALLAELARDSEPELRMAAVRTLADVRGEAAHALLANAIRADPDPHVRIQALDAAVQRRHRIQSDPEEFREDIRAALYGDADAQVRCTAAYACCETGVVREMEAALAQEAIPDVRAAMVLRLGASPDPEARAVVWRILDDPGAAEDVRLQAVRTIGPRDGPNETLVPRLEAMAARERSEKVRQALKNEIDWLTGAPSSPATKPVFPECRH